MSNRNNYLELISTLHFNVITTSVRMYCRSNHCILSQTIKGKHPASKNSISYKIIHNPQGFLSDSNSIESVDSVSDPKVDPDWIRIHLSRRIEIQTELSPTKKEKIKKFHV
jgi:hypothetical protein